MLKTKPLNALLTQSLSEHVSSALLFTPSGNLLATASNPSSSGARQARVHAALAANIWTNYDAVATKGVMSNSLSSLPSTSSSTVQSNLSTPRPASSPTDNINSITIELSDHNLHIQTVTPAILLALIGPKQITHQSSSNSSQHSQETIEAEGSAPRARSLKSNSVLSGQITSNNTGGSGSGSSNKSSGTLGVLKLSAQALVDYLKDELKDFEPPENI